MASFGDFGTSPKISVFQIWVAVFLKSFFGFPTSGFGDSLRVVWKPNETDKCHMIRFLGVTEIQKNLGKISIKI